MTGTPPGRAGGVTVTARSERAVTVLEVAGEIDSVSRDAMAEPVFTHLAAERAAFVLDLTRVGFIGSAGLAILAAAQLHTQQLGIKLGIVANSRVVLRPLTIVGFLEVVPIYDTVSDAVSDLSP